MTAKAFPAPFHGAGRTYGNGPFELLAPVEVRSDDEPRFAGGSNIRALLLNGGKVLRCG